MYNDIKMLIFGISVLVAGAIFLVIAILLCCGLTGILHDYHTTNVKDEDRKKMGLSIGLSMLVGTLGMFSSGIVSIVTNDESIIVLPILLLVIPLIITIVLSLLFVKKYNGEIFG